MAFVTLVNHHGSDSRQFRIALHALHEQPGRDHLDPRPGITDPLVPHRVADTPTRLLAKQFGQPSGRGPRSDPPRFGDHDVPLESIGERERQQRGLARSGGDTSTALPVRVPPRSSPAAPPGPADRPPAPRAVAARTTHPDASRVAPAFRERPGARPSIGSIGPLTAKKRAAKSPPSIAATHCEIAAVSGGLCQRYLAWSGRWSHGRCP